MNYNLIDDKSENKFKELKSLIDLFMKKSLVIEIQNMKAYFRYFSIKESFYRT